MRSLLTGWSFRSHALVLAVGFAPVLCPTTAASAEYYVSASASTEGTGDERTPWASIQTAIRAAHPGDIIKLVDGIYREDIKSVRSGTADARITVEGSEQVVLQGAGANRIVEINHDYITLKGFTVDGRHGNGKGKKGYRDKLLYVIGTSPGRGVSGLLVTQMQFRNAGGECLRLRYQARRNEVSYSTFHNCGVYDFMFDDGGKNGEGIYIGTAPEQLGKWGAPDAARDHSNENWIHHNRFDTQGNECVDIKEGSSNNVVEFNDCTGQRDEESGGFDSRGDRNVFRFNTVYGTIGAGVRLGGDEETDGVGNDVYGNAFRSTAAGGLNIQRLDQGKVCENTFESVDPIVMSDNEGFFDPEASCNSPLASSEGRAVKASIPRKQVDDDAPPLKCPAARGGCLVGRVDDKAERIKIFDASDVSLRGHRYRLSQAHGAGHGQELDLDSLAGRIIQIEFRRVADEVIEDAVLLSVIGED